MSHIPRQAILRVAAAALAGALLAAASCSDTPPPPPPAPDAPPPPAVDAAVDQTTPPDAIADLALPDHSLGHGPPYPIVLVHGFFGFESIGPLTYFYEVEAAMELDGHQVEVTAVDPFNSTYVRGPQLLAQVKDILARTGAAKVNLIGHSQGGFDARYVAAEIPERIGAVVTVGTPHTGLRIADVMLGYAPGFTVELAKAFFKAVSRPFYGDVAQDADLKACLEFMASDSIKAFNLNVPNAPGVAYYSIAGRSDSKLARSACLAPQAPPFITKYADDRDPVDPLLYIVSKVVGESLLDPIPNDGLVQVEEAKWGTWLGCIPADHWDEVGQLLGDSPGGDNPFDHRVFYRDLAAFLVDQGF